MGRKVHPIGFRIGGIRDWQAKWFADKSYAEPLQEDLKLRQAIQAEYVKAATSQIQIDRQANMVSVTVHTARPGVVIGRGGQRVDKLRLHLESLIGKKIQLNIQEIQQPELDAYLVARAIGDQIESRISYRRAMKQAISRTIMAGAKGIRVNCAGRLGGAEIARRQTMHEGQVPLHTLRADIDYGFAEARTTLGRIGVKVWIYKGDVLPEIEELAEIEEAPPEVAVAEEAEAPAEVVAEEKAEVEAEVKPEEAPEVKPEKKAAKPAAKKKAVAKPKEAKPAVSKKETTAAKEKKKSVTTKEG
jgi:small subunit ribosomal protein S3